jgi:hypothetical protein
MDITLSYLIGLALMLSLVSLISAVLVRLGARAILQEQVGFRKAFWVSFAAFGIGLFLQKVIGEAAGPFSAIAIFGACWLIGANVFRFGVDKQKSYAKTLALTAAQFLGLMTIAAAIAVTFVALR